MDHGEFLVKMKNCTIVYVEDDEGIQKSISEYLRRYTDNVYIASNGIDGYDLYTKVKPNIMLLDINMPKLNGIELAKKIRENDKTTRIIMATAYTNKEFMLDAVELSLTKYLVKPITVDEISGAFKKSLMEIEELDPEFTNLDLGNGYSYNQKSRLLRYKSKEIVLRNKELVLLDFMSRNMNKVLTYEVLENVLWNDSLVSINALKAQIKNLRKKLYDGLIVNISGVGYKMSPVVE